MANVFVTGGTGYIGQRLIPELLGRGHTVRALVRNGSDAKLPEGAAIVRGNALDGATFASQVAPSDTFVQLVGVAHPSPVMRDYVAVRAEGERLVRESGIAATFIRPWYVLGPGHRWPYFILPLYWLLGLNPKSRDTARRLYPVKLRSVVRAIADAVDRPPDGVRIIEAPAMRRA